MRDDGLYAKTVDAKTPRQQSRHERTGRTRVKKPRPTAQLPTCGVLFEPLKRAIAAKETREKVKPDGLL
jgi:hypothetical protein